MYTTKSIFFFALLLSVKEIFSFCPTPRPVRTSALSMAYVPDGLTPEQYAKIKQGDKTKLGKDLGHLGPKGFKSRSMQAWQEAYEKGAAGHTFAPVGYRKQIKQGKLRKEEVPYMVRGGSWDNSDIFGARRLKWGKTDKEYARGGYKKEQSASILGSGPGLNWTGEKRDPSKKANIPGFS
jgi:hypothetical protein